MITLEKPGKKCVYDEGGADSSCTAEEHMFGKSEGSLTHTHTHTPRPSNSAMCQSYSHVGTAEVDLINFPFIQTANYTLTHNHSRHSTAKTEGSKSGRESL